VLIPKIPLQAHFSITYRCNHQCFYCFQEQGGHLEEEKVVQVIKKLAQGGIFSVVITGGEIFLRKDFFSILEKVDKSIYFDIETNGTLITEKEAEKLKTFDMLMKVIIDLDGTAFVHDAIHGERGAFQKTVEAITALREVGIPVETHTVLSQKNIQSLDGLIEILHNLNIKKHVLLPLVGHNTFQLTSDQYKAIEMNIKQWKLKYPEITTFLSMKKRNKGTERKIVNSPLYINPLGQVSPCPYGENCCVGNMVFDTFADVMLSLNTYYTTVCQKCGRV
jgi:MoaA/NifB/PqqE/SkfB family radical SAM enzyme